jgi:hypothetical protein
MLSLAQPPASEPAICVRSPVDMARLLLGAAPGRAMNCAYMARDRASDGDDENAARFWDEVVQLLA